MATIASCKFAADVTTLATYLAQKEAGDNITLEITPTNDLVVLDWGNDLISQIIQFVTNFFYHLQQEGLIYFFSDPIVPLADRLVQVFTADFGSLIKNYDSWMQHIWLEYQPRHPSTESDPFANVTFS